MRIAIFSKVPAARCYHCGTTGVKMICHHCGRLMCQEDGERISAKGTQARSPEFAGLGLDEMLGRGSTPVPTRWEVHCEDCAHPAPKRYGWLIALGLLVAFMGLVAALSSEGPATGGVLLVVGLLMTIIGIALNSQTPTTTLSPEVGVPLVPNMRMLKVEETIKGNLTLDAEGRTRSEVQSGEGRIVCQMAFTPGDRERCQAYRSVHKLAADYELPFHAGFLVLSGDPQMKFLNTELYMEGRPNIIALRGWVNEHRFLSVGEEARDNVWEQEWPYTYAAGPGFLRDRLPDLPIHVIPSLVQGSERKGLELELQLTQEGRTAGMRVDRFELRVPTSAGSVVEAQPEALLAPTSLLGAEAQNFLSITWQHLGFTADEMREGRKTCRVMFADAIPQSTCLYGRLRLAMSGSPSGLTKIALFYPWGRERSNVTSQHETTVEVTFELHLDSLRDQDSVTLNKVQTFDGIAPDFKLANALSDKLSSQRLYVKWMIENPPLTSRHGAQMVSRYWNMGGRLYEGLFPVDWHLVITGEEPVVNTAMKNGGRSQFDVTVRASVANDEMRELVYNLSEQIMSLIAEVAAQRG